MYEECLQAGKGVDFLLLRGYRHDRGGMEKGALGGGGTLMYNIRFAIS